MRAISPPQQALIQKHGAIYLDGTDLMVVQRSRPVPIARGVTVFTGEAYLQGTDLYRRNGWGKFVPFKRNVSKLFGESYVQNGLLYFMRPEGEPAKIDISVQHVFEGGRSFLHEEDLYFIDDTGKPINQHIRPDAVSKRLVQKDAVLYFIANDGQKTKIGFPIREFCHPLFVRNRNQLCAVDDQGNIGIVDNGVTRVGDGCYLKGSILCRLLEGNRSETVKLKGQVTALHGKQFVLRRGKWAAVCQLNEDGEYRELSTVPKDVAEFERRIAEAA